ncbi:hypothetical protein [Jiangella alba]|uniref:Uncharacterized protein n=1 Tax=Jiangella alba TaxID=561176 RepID=A0A1H5PYG4_9ACTN|nr:hypothetical protein [Jiangella alba]SEF18749.1 hypothetical protein SAMN04488561_6818 [Jiangella alba]
MIRRALLTVAVLLATAAPASAVDPGSGSPGFCPDDRGVTVVIDFQALGGTTIVRCAPGPAGPGFTGLDALYDAGIEIEGVRRWGEAFICRVEGRPGPGEQVPVTGNGGYVEACIDTPPAAAYWSYWHAPNGGTWEYSQWGVKNRDAIPGGFEGWSFSLNATAASNPAPRIAPVRPDDPPDQPPQQDPQPRPTSDDPDEQAPGGGGGNNAPRPGGTEGGGSGSADGGTGGGAGSGADGGAEDGGGAAEGGTTGDGTADGVLPPPLPRESVAPPVPGRPATPAATPSEQPTWTGGEESAAPVASGAEVGGVPVATLIAVAAGIAVAAAAVVTARRRRSSAT